MSTELAGFSLVDIGIVIGTIILVFFITRRLARQTTYDGKKLPPREDSWLPFLGSIISFAPSPVSWLQSMKKKHGDIFTTTLLGKEITFLTHPRVYDLFFKAYDDELGVREVYNFITPVFGKGVVYDASPEIFAQQLRFVSSGMTVSAFRRFVLVFQEEVDQKAKQLGFPTAKDPKTFEAFDVLSDLIIFTASRSLLGDGVRQYLADKNMAQLYHNIDDGISPLSFFFPNFPFPSNKKRDAARDAVAAVFQELVNKRREEMKALTEDKYPQDVLTELIRGRYKNGEKLPDVHIIGVLIAGLFGGQHTSAITSTWTLLNILHNPRIYEKVMKEQEEVFEGELDGALTYERVRSMDYLEKCIREALRMYPPLILLFRYVKKARILGDLIIPKGQVLAVSPSLTGSCDDIFTNPDEFEPERMDRNEHEKHTHANLAFGSGRHKCVGENYALLQVKGVISCLLRKYHMKLASPFPEINYASMVVGPKPPCTIQYCARTPEDGFAVKM